MRSRKASEVAACPAVDVFEGGLLVRVTGKVPAVGQGFPTFVTFEVDATLALVLATQVEVAARECLEARRGWSPSDRERPGPGLESDVAKAKTALAYAGIAPGDIVTMAVAAARIVEQAAAIVADDAEKLIKREEGDS